MAGIMYRWWYFDALDVWWITRGVHLYNPVSYFHGTGDADRYGLGLIKFGDDYLVPSLDYNRDICCYIRGADSIYTSNAACPYFALPTNHAPTTTRIAALYNNSSDMTIGMIGAPNSGYWVGTTLRSTDKLRGSTYDTYDTSLHHTAGRAGITTSAMMDFKNYDDSGRYHSALYYFDFVNKHVPTYCALLATNNITIKSIGVRHGSTAPTYISSLGGFYVELLDERGSNFYYNSVTGNQPFRAEGRLIYNEDGSLKTVTINNTEYILEFVSLTMPMSDSGNQYAYFETPYLNVIRTDNSKIGKMYFLDECITIHRPDASPPPQ